MQNQLPQKRFTMQGKQISFSESHWCLQEKVLRKEQKKRVAQIMIELTWSN